MLHKKNGLLALLDHKLKGICIQRIWWTVDSNISVVQVSFECALLFRALIALVPRGHFKDDKPPNRHKPNHILHLDIQYDVFWLPI